MAGEGWESKRELLHQAKIGSMFDIFVQFLLGGNAKTLYPWRRSFHNYLIYQAFLNPPIPLRPGMGIASIAINFVFLRSGIGLGLRNVEKTRELLGAEIIEVGSMVGKSSLIKSWFPSRYAEENNGQEKETRYAELVKLFGFVLNQYRFYSEKHPAAQLAAQNFSTSLEKILALESTLVLGSVRGRMIINEHPLDPKQNGVAGLLKECERFGIESLTFELGADSDEIISFFKLMASPAKTLEEKGGFAQAFQMAHLQHIRLGTTRYQVVKEEEEVVGRSEIGGKEEGNEKVPCEQVRKIDTMEEVIEYYLTGSPETVTFDTERLSYEVERRPKAVAEAMIRRAIHLEVLKKIVDGIQNFLKEILAPLHVQEGKDFSQVIYTLAKEFKKTLKEVGFKGAGDQVFALERCADTVKVETMVRAFKVGDQKTLERTARLCRKGAREKLKDRLGDLGVEEGVFERLFSERRRLPRSRKVYVSSEELEELRRIRDRFEDELSLQVSQRTNVIEREKMEAVRERERMETIVRNLGQALVVVDVDEKVQFMNSAAEKLLGIRQKQGKGIAIHELVNEEHLLVLAKDSLRGQTDRTVEEIEVTSKNDETRRVLQASTAVIESEDGKTVGMLSVLNDIAKQKSLDESKSRFLVSVTHEHQTPSAGD